MILNIVMAGPVHQYQMFLTTLPILAATHIPDLIHLNIIEGTHLDPHLICVLSPATPIDTSHFSVVSHIHIVFLTYTCLQLPH